MYGRVAVCHSFVCQIEQLKQELNKKESEMQALQTKLETLTNQNSDCKQHIDVLKESLNAKEQRANTLQTEVSAKHTSTVWDKDTIYRKTHLDKSGLCWWWGRFSWLRWAVNL